MDPWIHGSAAGTAARPAAGAAAGAAASAAAACIYYVIIGGALRAPLYVHDKIHTAAAAEAAAPATAYDQAALAATSATDPWIHGSIFFIMKHIFYTPLPHIRNPHIRNETLKRRLSKNFENFFLFYFLIFAQGLKIEIHKFFKEV